MSNIITVRLEIHNGDVTPQFPWPVPIIGITEVLSITFTGGQWEVTNLEGMWTGRAESRNGAILDYLRARLDIPKE